MSLSSIYAHKLRSLLTMLGIIIGIASVICVSALGLGAKEKILSSISSIGTNTVQIVAGRSLGDIRAGKTRLALSDMDLLKKLPFLDAVEAYMRNLGIATYKDKSLRALLYGVGANHLRLKGLELAAGRPINAIDIKQNANITVIDSNTRKNLFANLPPSKLLGKVIIYDHQPLRIVGVLKPEDRYNFSDDTIKLYVPYTTSMNKLSGTKRIKAIVTKIASGYNPKLAEDELVRLLKLKRGKKDFYTINSDSIQKAVEENSATLMLLIMGVALISLIVGGIGVMNIMLVCVSERTKEIGIKMAIGATRADIKMQFLIEAILICLIGSVLGLGLSLLIIFLFNSQGFGIDMIISINAVLLGLFSSIFIGVVFGFFPARNASLLDPIKALS